MIRGVALALLLSGSAAAGDERGYELRDYATKKPAPLLVALSCYSCPPSFVPQKLGLDELARRHKAMLAIPIARTDKDGNPFWNATAACCDFDGKKPDDVGYVLHVIDDAVKKHGADPKQVYLFGISNGGFLAYRIACDHADKIAAIVSVGGAAPADVQAVVAGGGAGGGDLPRRRQPLAAEQVDDAEETIGAPHPDTLDPSS